MEDFNMDQLSLNELMNITEPPSTEVKPQMSSDQVDAVIGGAAQLGSSIISGVAQTRQLREARQEARDLSQQFRQDTLSQRDIDDKLKRAAQKQQLKAFQLEKKKYNIDRKFKLFEDALEKRLKNQNTVMNSFGRLNQLAQNNFGVKQMLKQWAQV